LLVRYRGRVDVEAIGGVEGVIGDTSGVKGEEIADRLTVDSDADRVEQDESPDASGVIADGHLGADPTTEGRTDDQNIAQVIVLEVAQVSERDIVDCPRPSRDEGCRSSQGGSG